jgi:hypothetical protein
MVGLPDVDDILLNEPDSTLETYRAFIDDPIAVSDHRQVESIEEGEKIQ